MSEDSTSFKNYILWSELAAYLHKQKYYTSLEIAKTAIKEYYTTGKVGESEDADWEANAVKKDGKTVDV